MPWESGSISALVSMSTAHDLVDVPGAKRSRRAAATVKPRRNSCLLCQTQHRAMFTATLRERSKFAAVETTYFAMKRLSEVRAGDDKTGLGSDQEHPTRRSAPDNLPIVKIPKAGARPNLLKRAIPGVKVWDILSELVDAVRIAGQWSGRACMSHVTCGCSSVEYCGCSSGSRAARRPRHKLCDTPRA